MVGFEMYLAGFLTKESTEQVAAYLNILVFDEDFNFVDGGYQQLRTQAKENGSGVAHDHLSTGEFSITKPGYVYVWLSNEGEQLVDVFFDDLKVTHKHGPVVQADDYYPFGLTFNSYVSGDKNKYLYNGKELNEELGLDWYDYHARQYDPVLGRFHVIDPMADALSGVSPYNYVLNNPLSLTDPTGMFPSVGEVEQRTNAERAASVNDGRLRSGENGDPSGGGEDKVYSGGMLNEVVVSPRSENINSTSDLILAAGNAFDAMPNPGDEYSTWDEFNAANDAWIASMGANSYEEALNAWYKTTNAYRKDQADKGRYMMLGMTYGVGIMGIGVGSVSSGGVSQISPRGYGISPRGIGGNGIKLYPSLQAKFGAGYRSLGVAPGKYLGIQYGRQLNTLSPGRWSKIYEAGRLNGQKVEVHYMYNSRNGLYVNPFIKTGSWGSRAFKGLE